MVRDDVVDTGRTYGSAEAVNGEARRDRLVTLIGETSLEVYDALLDER